MSSNTTTTGSHGTEGYAPATRRLMRLSQEEHIPDKGMSQWWFADGAERIDFDHEQFTRTETTRFTPAIEYRSEARYLYRLPDYGIVVLWTRADYNEFDTYAGNITVPDGYELWINNESLVLSNGGGTESELGNWSPTTPLRTVTDNITRIIATNRSEAESGAAAVNLEDYDLETTQPTGTTEERIDLDDYDLQTIDIDDDNIEDLIVDDYFDDIRREHGRAVAKEWARQQRAEVRAWMTRHDAQVGRNRADDEQRKEVEQ